MSHETEHDVRVEPDDIFFESGFVSSILPAATEMPHFTDEELEYGLSEEYRRLVGRVFQAADKRVR